MTILSITSCVSTIGSSIAGALAKTDLKQFKEIRMLCEHESNVHNHFDIPEPNSKKFVYHQVSQTNKEALTEAIRGSHFLIIIPPVSHNKWKSVQAIVDAAQLAKVKDCIFISWTGTRADVPDDTFQLSEFHDYETKFLSSAIKIQHKLIVRVNYLVQNLLTYSAIVIHDGVLPLPMGTGLFAPVDSTSLGDAIAKLCSHKGLDSKYAGQTMNFTGPKAVSGVQIAHALSKVLGKEVTYKDISINDAHKVLLTAKPKLEESEIQVLMDFFKLVKHGIMERVSTDFSDLQVEHPTLHHSLQDIKPRLLNLAAVTDAQSHHKV